MSEKGRRMFCNQNQLKAEVALEAIRGVRTANEIGQEFGVYPTHLREWKLAL